MGNTHLPNKMREIERIVQQERPSILGISEANMKINQDLEKVIVQGYITSSLPANIMKTQEE